MRGGFRKGVNLSPKKLDQMMKQVGLSVEEMNDVEEVVIKTADAELVFEDASVTIMDAQGSKMYQITGTPVKRPKRELAPEQEEEHEVSISAEDVEIVVEKAGCSAEEAKATLIETRGDLAEAISRLCENEK
ncbi:MAG: nascent polypeptide-associated complex protein [Halobacteriota archaeon]